MNGSFVHWLITHPISIEHVVCWALVLLLGMETQWWRQSPCSIWSLSSTVTSFQSPPPSLSLGHTSPSTTTTTLSPLQVTRLYLIQKCLWLPKTLLFVYLLTHFFPVYPPLAPPQPPQIIHFVKAGTMTSHLPLCSLHSAGYYSLSAPIIQPNFNSKIPEKKIIWAIHLSNSFAFLCRLGWCVEFIKKS